MKNRIKLFGIIALVAIIGFSMAACSNDDDGGGGGGGEGGSYKSGFTSISAFETWLDAQPANDAATAYLVKLNVSDLGGNTIGNPQSAGYVLNNNKTKYVSLDLSGSTITSIESFAFMNCSSLTSVTIPASVTSIEDGAFANCTSLTSVTIPDSVTIIWSRAFDDCTSLASITIPDSVTRIGSSAFSGCTSLASITIPDSVTSIGSSAFDGTAWYNSKEDGIVYAGKVAYKYKGDMPANTSITLTDGTKGIAGSAFDGCTSLASVTIPNSVTSIGESAFRGCTSLTSVTFEGTISSSNFNSDAFGYSYSYIGDLRTKFYATDDTNGTPGTYTRPSDGKVWTKQS